MSGPPSRLALTIALAGVGGFSAFLATASRFAPFWVALAGLFLLTAGCSLVGLVRSVRSHTTPVRTSRLDDGPGRPSADARDDGSR